MTGPLLLLLLQAAPIAVAPPIAAPPVPDPILAEQRGGFRLPSGVDVALTVQTQTAVNGAVLLRTVFQLDQGAPQLTIYSPKAGEVVATVAGGAGQGAQAVAPSISYDRMTGVQVTRATLSPMASVSVAAGSPADVPAGLGQVAAGAVTDAGTIGDTTHNGVRAVSLTGSDFTITHLAGNAFGAAIANSGSDRTIDTQTTVSVTLGNTGADMLGSAMFRVQDIAIDAAASRGN